VFSAPRIMQPPHTSKCLSWWCFQHHALCNPTHRSKCLSWWCLQHHALCHPTHPGKCLSWWCFQHHALCHPTHPGNVCRDGVFSTMLYATPHTNYREVSNMARKLHVVLSVPSRYSCLLTWPLTWTFASSVSINRRGNCHRHQFQSKSFCACSMRRMIGPCDFKKNVCVDDHVTANRIFLPLLS
jgi:hypothetical protein